MTAVGVRELKDHLSRYLRRVEAGERLQITAHGRPVAGLAPLAAAPARSPWDEMVAAGVLHPAKTPGRKIRWPKIKLPPGTAAALINEDRGD